MPKVGEHVLHRYNTKKLMVTFVKLFRDTTSFIHTPSSKFNHGLLPKMSGTDAAFINAQANTPS